jgi:hypothetical protein
MEEFEERVISEASASMLTKSSSRRRTAAKLTLLILPVLFGLQTMLQRWMNRGAFQTLSAYSTIPKQNDRSFFIPQPSNSQFNTAFYTINNEVRKEYALWHSTVRNLSQMNLKEPNWEPTVNWEIHPRDRHERFPSAVERVEYYMGKWYNTTIPMYGKEFERKTFIHRKTTRDYGPFSDILVNLYNLDKRELYNCFKNKNELQVMSPYCRDYMDIAILHEGSANVMHFIGDGLPTYLPEELKKYPIFAKVRPSCSDKACQKNKIESILLPLNRKRHFGVASLVPENDISWDEKIAKAVWRGKFGKTHDTIKDTNDIKFALVSRHVNSTIVDAKFSKHTKGAPYHMIGSYLDMKEQLKYKYIISIEGNDVSSGLKWMLFSNSVVLMPKPSWESWAMEGKLEPNVHYLPIERDMTNVEEVIRWAEDHPEKTRMIAERSTLFIYDLLFHPQAHIDEQNIMISIMERFENNFGYSAEMSLKHPLEVKWSNHPIERAHRFPSVEERMMYVMSDWYHDTRSIPISTPQLNLNNIPSDDLFIASGQHLSFCSMSNSSYSAKIRQFCQESLPEYDDRVTADLKSNSYERLRASAKGEHMRLAPYSSWRTDSGGSKESKRVLLNDATKILYYGDDTCKTAEVPFFTSSRGTGDCNGNGILWPFGSGSAALELVKSGQVEEMDIDFQQKKPTLYFITSNTFSNTSGMSGVLSNRYLVKAEKYSTSTGDLLAMMLSKSVVLMTAKLQTNSWFMESYLKPYLHFVPVDFADPSDLERKMKWCEQNLDEARKISERATLFVHDLLFHRKAERDDEEVKFRVMERYAMLYGANQ